MKTSYIATAGLIALASVIGLVVLVQKHPYLYDINDDSWQMALSSRNHDTARRSNTNKTPRQWPTKNAISEQMPDCKQRAGTEHKLFENVLCSPNAKSL